ncbi:guanine nucleotide exchange factor VAV3-like isoform X2 [Carassius carassius]|uniref:guanine nucleotide exchange factor VAV3-like isoform X1 n=1 Tax=Carassius carassius TaxID=217509 RepID=UPI0028692AEC|nr:guanine nucleotide exchange factor VAV3-like isoform X1 [Carassius carassius]XP_059391064.1 guanine nucleotide exchange factor VAV3-like isoform X2 [Carassius carassius]
MEHWRQCALWLINCKVLPPNHRVTWESAQVFDLAQTLRDGVLLCQLLNNLRPQSINLREINLRPQMSQFLCLKNIRTFLHACSEIFGMKKSELFEAFDLFDVRDFGKVMDTLSKLSHTHIAQQTGIRSFPTEESVDDEDIYNHLEDLIDENGVEDEEDLYDCVYDDDEGGEVYEDLMKVELVQPQKQAETDIRSCCLMEIKQTEEKYTETLDSIEKFFMKPLGQSLSRVEIEKVFVNIPDLVKVHMSLLREVQDSVLMHNASNLYQIFIKYKERLVLYGKYCSQVEIAIACLDDICKNREDVRQMLELCSKRANNGKFTLRDLLVVPMQRVLKYHLLLQELVKHTHDATDKSNLRQALDAMKDLAQYVNEVKRDIETLQNIDQYQKSIENLNQSLRNYGRPKGDSEVRVASVDKRAKQDRHIFLFDSAVIVCKRRGDNYEMKEVIDLHSFKITNNPTSERENRKWCHGFYLTHNQGQSGFEFFFKTKELKKKWLEQFGMALSNICPESGKSNFHEFRMHTFETTTSCSSCEMLLRGVFYQGYRCSKCGAGAHKECLGRVDFCVKSSADSSSFGPQIGKTPCRGGDAGLPKMQVIHNYYGVPSPLCGPPLNIQVGDVIEVIEANIRSCWWKGKVLATKEVGFFPSNAVKPCPCVPKPVDYSSQPWFAGPMERLQAEAALLNRRSSTYLVRHRSREFNEYAISIKYNNDVKHIKILTKEGLFHIAENRKFRSILELIEYYKHHSLREGFRTLDTTLLFAYREPENGANTPLLCGLSFLTPAGYSFVPPSSAPFWSVFTPKVLGVAIARYDFSSRDTRELTLQEGDVVKIYSKTGANGWWRGEVNGRVGWFPSTYVEEGEE